MKGGAQSHLLRCRYQDLQGKERRDGYFIVKFQNNPQHIRVLANELLCTRLAEWIGLPVPHCEQVEVSPELVAGTPDLHVELAQGIEPCRAGRQFGSLFPGDPRFTPVFDYIANETLDGLANLGAFAGMLAFDQWVCNTNGRQAVFLRGEKGYQALMIDQGFGFNDGEWNFPDAPLRGLYFRRRVYRSIRGWESFSPWLERIQQIDPETLDRISREVPLEWRDDPEDHLELLMEQLYRRRQRVVELLLAVRRNKGEIFPNWRTQ